MTPHGEAGDVVFAVDDLHQSIANIILTPKGSVPTKPEKGCDVLGAIDKHPDIGIPLMTREIWDALALWEPRIVVQKVEVTMPEFSRFSTSVFWRPIESVMDDGTSIERKPDLLQLGVSGMVFVC